LIGQSATDSIPYHPADTHFTQFKPFHKYPNILGIFSNLQDVERALKFFKILMDFSKYS